MTNDLLQAIAVANAIKSNLMDLLMERNDIVSEAWDETARLVPKSQKDNLQKIARKTNSETNRIDLAIFDTLAKYHEASETVRNLMEKH